LLYPCPVIPGGRREGGEADRARVAVDAGREKRRQEETDTRPTTQPALTSKARGKRKRRAFLRGGLRGKEFEKKRTRRDKNRTKATSKKAVVYTGGRLR